MGVSGKEATVVEKAGGPTRKDGGTSEFEPKVRNLGGPIEIINPTKLP
jgi:hypothetical protein